MLLTQKEKNSRSNTLSSRFGYGQFPFHTDGASLPIPPRFVLMRSLNDDSSLQPTLISSLRWPKKRTFLYETLADTMLPFTTGNGYFYSAIITRESRDREDYIRYNPCCIKAEAVAYNNINMLLEKMIKNSTLSAVEWKLGTVVILDNWRVLHGRGAASNMYCIGKRILERCWVR